MATIPAFSTLRRVSVSPLASLVYRVVIGQVQVREPMFLQDQQPLRLRTEDEALEDRGLHPRRRTLQVAHDDMCRAQHAVNTL